MSDMDPCPECGGELTPTLSPLFGWFCTKCLQVYVPKGPEEMNLDELRAVLRFSGDKMEFEIKRTEKAEAKLAKLVKVAREYFGPMDSDACYSVSRKEAAFIKALEECEKP